jgi:putative ABC transport system permease protein
MPDDSTSSTFWTAHLRPRLAGLRLSPAREAEIIEELSQHLDARYEELIATGISQDEARRLALEELREPETLAHSMRPLRQSNVPAPITPGVSRRFPVTDLWQDMRYAARVLRRQPGFTAAAVITLALGIGANTAIFSLINATLLQRLPVANRDRLVYVWRGNVGGVFPYPLYASLRDNNRVFDAFAVWGGITASLNADNVTDLVQGVIVTGNLFDTLGVRAERGRLLSRSDDMTVGGHPVAVISHGFWQTRFAARPDIVGHDILLNGHSFTIVGVTPPAFRGPQVGGQPDLYVPMMMQAIMRPPRAAYSGEMNPDLLNNKTNSWLFGVARLKPGIAAEQARADLVPIEAAYASTVGPGARATGVAVLPVDEGNPAQRQRLRLVALLLAGVVGAVLLIACANIANMLLARAAARRREIAVRLALGASAGRLFRQLLTESVLLSLVGGLLGLGLAWALARAVAGAPPPRGALPLLVEFAIDGRVLVFSFVLSVLTGIVFGALPARRATKPSVVPALKDAAADSTEHRRRFQLAEDARRRRGGAVDAVAHPRGSFRTESAGGARDRSGIRRRSDRVGTAVDQSPPLYKRSGARILSADHRACAARTRCRSSQRGAGANAERHRPHARLPGRGTAGTRSRLRVQRGWRHHQKPQSDQCQCRQPRVLQDDGDPDHDRAGLR